MSGSMTLTFEGANNLRFVFNVHPRYIKWVKIAEERENDSPYPWGEDRFQIGVEEFGKFTPLVMWVEGWIEAGHAWAFGHVYRQKDINLRSLVTIEEFCEGNPDHYHTVWDSDGAEVDHIYCAIPDTWQKATQWRIDALTIDLPE